MKTECHPVDKRVGERIRAARWAANISQTTLAEIIGVKFQQVQKYETGANRISASRLWMTAEALNLPIQYFFDGIESTADQAAQAPEYSRAEISMISAMRKLSPEKLSAFQKLLESM